MALECLNVIEDKHIYAQVRDMEKTLLVNMCEVAKQTKKLKNIRCIGAIVAADLDINEAMHPRAGYNVFQQAVKLGALLKPLGNTIYWTPPLDTSEDTLIELRNITTKPIQMALE